MLQCIGFTHHIFKALVLKCWCDNCQYAPIFSDECVGNESWLNTAISLIFELLCFCLFLIGSHYKHNCWCYGDFYLSENRVRISGFSLCNSIGEAGRICCYWIVCILYFKSVPCSNQAWILRPILHYSVALHSIPICGSDCIRRHLGKP